MSDHHRLLCLPPPKQLLPIPYRHPSGMQQLCAPHPPQFAFWDTHSHLKQWPLGGSIFLNHFQVLYSWKTKLSVSEREGGMALLPNPTLWPANSLCGGHRARRVRGLIQSRKHRCWPPPATQPWVGSQ